MRRRTSRFPSVLFYAMTALTTVVVPFTLSTAVLDPAILPRFTAWAAGLALVSGLTVAHLLLHRPPLFGFGRSPLLGFGLLYLAATAAGFLVALNLEDWLYATLRTGLFVLHISLFALILSWNRDKIDRLVFIVTSVALLLAAVGLLQYGGGLFMYTRSVDPPYGTSMNQNLFASFLFLSLPMVLYGILRRKGLARIFYVLAAAAILATVIAATTRSVWAASTLGLGLAGLVYVVADRKLGVETIGRTGVQKRWASLIGFALVLAVSFVFLFKVSDRFDDIEERTVLWRKTAVMAKNHPLLGVGAGNWVAHTNIENMRSQISKTNWVRPHNDPLWVVSETGIFGLIGYLGLFLSALWLLWRVLRKEDDPDRKALAVSLLFGLIGFLMISGASFPRERIEHSAYIGMYLALSFVLFRISHPRDIDSALDTKSLPARAPKRLPAAGMAVAALIGVFAAVVGGFRIKAETHVQDAHVAMMRKQWEPAVRAIDQAVGTPFYSAHPNGLTLEYMRGNALYEMGEYRAAIRDFQQAYRDNPKQIMNTWWIGRSHLHLGNYKEAVEAFEVCLAWWPNNKFTLPVLAIAEYRLGQYEDAFIHLLHFRKTIHEDRKIGTYDKLWSALQAQLGPTRVQELIEQDDFVPRVRNWKQTN